MSAQSQIWNNLQSNGANKKKLIKQSNFPDSKQDFQFNKHPPEIEKDKYDCSERAE